MKELLSQEETEGLLAGLAVAADEVSAGSANSDLDVTEDTGRRLIEQSFHYWEQTVHDLQREVKELKDRIEQLERIHEEPQPVKLTLPEPPSPEESEDPRPSRSERHRKSRWF
jgi:hypothetical protein